MMKQVLFIAYLFPPRGGGGVQRSAKFVKYLPEFGWMPSVLSGPTRRGQAVDTSLLSDLPSAVCVNVAKGFELPDWLPWRAQKLITRWALTIDGHIGWWPAAVKQGRSILESDEFSAIYSTSAPFTDHLVARSLQEETGLPWVADFRDLWLDSFSTQFATRWHRNLCSKLEDSVVRQSNKVIVVNDPMKGQMLKSHPGTLDHRLQVIPNGFDKADYEGLAPMSKDLNKFTLTYTGALYGRRSSYPFLAALRNLLDRGLIRPEQFALRLIGSTGKEAKRLVKEWRLSRNVEFLGYVSHGGAISFQLGTDALLLIVGSGSGSNAVLTGKIFEYLASGKPILGLVPPGVAADLIHEAEAGMTVHPDDVNGIANALLSMFSAWQNGELANSPRTEVVSRFERRRLTARLAEILDEVSA
jgi:glycosyltransferase involved in cell wall biosynthesis